MTVKRHFVILLILAAVILGYASVKTLDAYNKENKKTQATLASLAPVHFYDEKGEKITLADFGGDVLLVNLWATWCPPCVAELPALDRLQARLKKEGFRVIAISMDRGDFQVVTDFLAQTDIQNLIPYWDKDREIVRKWSYQGLPTSFLIDRQGHVLRRYDGAYEWDQGDIFTEIAAAVQE